MNTVRVMSKNAAYQKFEVLRTNRNKRYRYGEFLVEGVRNINQAIRNGWQFTSLLYSPETPLSRLRRLTFRRPGAILEPDKRRRSCPWTQQYSEDSWRRPAGRRT